MDLFTFSLIALAAIVVFLIATHKSKKSETVAEEAPYKVETPEAKVEAVNAQPVAQGSGVAKAPAKAKKPAATKAPAKAKAPAKKPAATKAPAKKAPAKKPAATKAPAKPKAK